MRYQEIRAYSPVCDCELVRISTIGDGGAEYFALVPDRDYSGKEWREIRQQVTSALAATIESGRRPGEVEVEIDLEGLRK